MYHYPVLTYFQCVVDVLSISDSEFLVVNWKCQLFITDAALCRMTRSRETKRVESSKNIHIRNEAFSRSMYGGVMVGL